MTNNEAIESLRENYCCNRSVCELHSVDLCQKEKCEIWMAISALEAQEVKNSSQELKNSSDLISRQAAIEAVEHITSSMSICVNTDECHGMKRMQRQAVIELANLPSAQPERAIKDCRNCKHGNYNDHWGTYFCYHSGDCNDWDKWEPSAQPEPSIPISWIEKQIDWLKSMDNEFANLTAMNISTMVKKWEKEQEDNDGSDQQAGGD